MRDVRTFVTRALLAALIVGPLTGCDDENDPMMTDTQPRIEAAAGIDLGVLDVNFGPSGEQTVTVRNAGSAALEINSVAVTGSGAAEFAVDGPSATSLAPGGTLEIGVTFDPAAAGQRVADLEITSNDPDTPALRVALSGTGEARTYAQVDREGIPALNTVFNHPPAFSKTAYNTAGPASDVGTYRAQFETVLGAVANPDPMGTAALLLPDELPVSLGAATTSFAMLNGRALADDAVDVALQVTVGVESLQSDNVGANDVPFLMDFPYLAEPHR